MLRSARLVRPRAAVLGTLLHAPLAVGVIALLEGRFAIAAFGFAGHLLLALVNLPSLVLLPTFPGRFIALVLRAFVARSPWIFALLQLASVVFGVVFGLLLWAVFWAG